MGVTTSRTTSASDRHAAAGRVPALEEIYRLTERPEERVVFHDVDWSFYEQLVDSIPPAAHIHADYDGKDVEVMSEGQTHPGIGDRVDTFIKTVTREWRIPRVSLAQTSWKRREISRSLEADQCYYFLPEKIQTCTAARQRGSDDIADYPNPDLAVEVDISQPNVDRAGIYAALGVTEVWRITERKVLIDRLTPQGRCKTVKKSGFLSVRADEIQRWVLEEDGSDELDWEERLQAEFRQRAGG
jgi:Uma2 family endonuclease